MRSLREEQPIGLDYLDAMTKLLQRVRREHPTHGSYEAAEIQWWWGVHRSTDDLGQLFWFDDLGRPEAAVIVTDFGDGSSALYEEPTLVVIVMPDATSEFVGHVVERGFAHVAEFGIHAVELEVDRTDETTRNVLFGRGFTVQGDGMVECWLDAADRPQISSPRGEYRLVSRRDTMHLPHHMARPERPDIEQRLLQTSLYRSDLDLLVVDQDDNVAAYGLFWFDPETATGVVEPMRTHDEHRRQGLGRHILTSGIDLLASAGADRIKICFQTRNPASGPLYRSVGFEPHRWTDVFSGSTLAPGS